MTYERVVGYRLGFPLQKIKIPQDAEILHIGETNDGMWLWARVCDDNPLEERQFMFLATGQIFEDDGSMDYIGTIITHHGVVMHLWEVKE